MEPVLTPPTDGDFPNAPETVPPATETLNTQEPDEPDDPTDLDDLDEDDSPDSVTEATEPEDSTSELEAEAAPPPETDPAMTFADLKLNRAVLDALNHAKYTHPTPIQEAVIPPALAGKDVIGQAQTGTGKTAAFILPFLSRWRPHRLKGPVGLVMTPTRELALQVAKESEKLADRKSVV